MVYQKFAKEISIHAPLAGCDLGKAGHIKITVISIHAPLAGCDQARCIQPARSCISIHAPLAGCDPSSPSGQPPCSDFNPRTPCGVRLVGQKSESLYIDDFNPRTPCGVRQAMRGVMRFADAISIHAPLAGCDFLRRLSANGSVGFQSTHPLRGATVRRKGSTSSSF